MHRNDCFYWSICVQVYIHTLVIGTSGESTSTVRNMLLPYGAISTLPWSSWSYHIPLALCCNDTYYGDLVNALPNSCRKLPHVPCRPSNSNNNIWVSLWANSYRRKEGLPGWNTLVEWPINIYDSLFSFIFPTTLVVIEANKKTASLLLIFK